MANPAAFTVVLTVSVENSLYTLLVSVSITERKFHQEVVELPYHWPATARACWQAFLHRTVNEGLPLAFLLHHEYNEILLDWVDFRLLHAGASWEERIAAAEKRHAVRSTPHAALTSAEERVQDAYYWEQVRTRSLKGV